MTSTIKSRQDTKCVITKYDTDIDMRTQKWAARSTFKRTHVSYIWISESHRTCQSQHEPQGQQCWQQHSQEQASTEARKGLRLLGHPPVSIAFASSQHGHVSYAWQSVPTSTDQHNCLQLRCMQRHICEAGDMQLKASHYRKVSVMLRRVHYGLV